MSQRLSLGGRLLRVIIPTRNQLLVVTFLSVAGLITIEHTSILSRLGINSQALQASSSQLSGRFGFITDSLVASNLALIAFWSLVGLAAYLVCWSLYNLLIEARNEVTLETQYANLGGQRGPWITLITKAVAGAGLIAALGIFKYGLSLAIALVEPVIIQVDATAIISALGGVVVLAAAIYLVLVFVELLFSAWYRPEAFTDV